MGQSNSCGSCPNLRRRLLMNSTAKDRFFSESCSIDTTQSSNSLLGLPAELRNEILELCVSEALTCPTCRKFYEPRIEARPEGMRVTGLSKLPRAQFVNRQLRQEVGSLLYSRIDLVKAEVPSLHYTMPSNPFVHKFAKRVLVEL